MERSPFLLFQVSLTNSSFCYRSSNYCLIAVSCPINTLGFRKCVYALFESFFASLLSRSRLLVAGDVESNPGPVTDGSDIQEKILATVQRVEDGQTGILAEIKTLKEQQKYSDEQIKRLSAKVTELEAELAKNKSAQKYLPLVTGSLLYLQSCTIWKQDAMTLKMDSVVLTYYFMGSWTRQTKRGPHPKKKFWIFVLVILTSAFTPITLKEPIALENIAPKKSAPS
ncbi:unnamed protein product [Ixodes hexagonus]